ncbi:hypothetical protein DFH08DRAFT_1025591 [Mycena albidolilacea]|uniref:Uncharacterized protein n=1 Tax=Mycena albidolilacea TaxID=1033008 RepID=A0AAD7F2L0_9AGAR|nr:hypothetical protein DFH08DRAFT_1025591 [Mycena albidolilacea]
MLQTAACQLKTPPASHFLCSAPVATSVLVVRRPLSAYNVDADGCAGNTCCLLPPPTPAQLISPRLSGTSLGRTCSHLPPNTATCHRTPVTAPHQLPSFLLSAPPFHPFFVVILDVGCKDDVRTSGASSYLSALLQRCHIPLHGARGAANTSLRTSNATAHTSILQREEMGSRAGCARQGGGETNDGIDIKSTHGHLVPALCCVRNKQQPFALIDLDLDVLLRHLLQGTQLTHLRSTI